MRETLDTALAALRGGAADAGAAAAAAPAAALAVARGGDRVLPAYAAQRATLAFAEKLALFGDLCDGTAALPATVAATAAAPGGETERALLASIARLYSALLSEEDFGEQLLLSDDGALRRMEPLQRCLAAAFPGVNLQRLDFVSFSVLFVGVFRF